MDALNFTVGWVGSNELLILSDLIILVDVPCSACTITIILFPTMVDLVHVLYLSKTSIQEQSTISAFHLPGVHFSYLEVVLVKWSSKSQTVDLNEYGFRIHFPPSVSAESEFKLTVGVSLSGTFDLPPNTTLVSATYYIETSVELLKPVEIEIEHCVSTKRTSGLIFASADTRSMSPPYQLRRLNGGIFSTGLSWGLIEVSTFSSYGILCEDTDPLIDYSGYLLSSNLSGGHFYAYHVLFLVVRKLSASKKV